MDINDDVSVRTKGRSVNSFRTSVYSDSNQNGHIQDDQKISNGTGTGGHQNGSFTHDVAGNIDNEVFHPVNGLSSRHKHNTHVYRDNSDSDSDTVVFDRKYSTNSQESFDSSGNEAQFQTKPLMHPRKKKAKTKVRTRQSKGFLQRCVWPTLYVVFFLGAVVALVLAIVYLVEFFSKAPLSSSSLGQKNVVGCSHVTKDNVWTVGIPKLMTESSFRLVDVNSDGVLDILFGFTTGLEAYTVENHLCDIYFNGSHPCVGGVIALEGATGRELWRHYTEHEVFGLNCGFDLDQDGVKDCLAGGRLATFEVISGKSGRKIWTAHSGELVKKMNFYTGQFVPDLDGDGIADVLNIHGGDPFGEPGSKTRLKGKIFLFSGRTGDVLQTVTVPDGRESYYSPVLLYRRGQLGVLFGTGGETHGGSLWYITLTDLYKGRIQQAKALYTDPYKGVMTPPVLLDMTGDGTLDIVFSAFNSSTFLVDGDSLQILWNYTYSGSETYSTPAAGYFTEDNVPDFMVHWQHGPGYPVYYYSITTVLDGATSQPVLEPFVKDAVGAQVSPLTVSMEGFGNDMFLYFTHDCVGFEGQDKEFSFVKGTNVHEKSRSDICHLRFNSEGVAYMNARNRHMDSPAILYNSEESKELERSAWVNTTAEGLQFLAKHPDHLQKYLEWKHYMKQYKAQSGTSNPTTEETQNNEGLNGDSTYNSLSDLIKMVLDSDDPASQFQVDNSDLSKEDVASLLKNINARDQSDSNVENESETDASAAQPFKTSAGERLTDSTINGYSEGEPNDGMETRQRENVGSQNFQSGRLSEESDGGRSGFLSRTGLNEGLRRDYQDSDFDSDFIVQPSLNRLRGFGSSRGSYFDDNPGLGDLNSRRYSPSVFNSDHSRTHTDRNPYQTRVNPFEDPDYQSFKNSDTFRKGPPENVRTNSRKRGNWQGLSGRRKRSPASGEGKANRKKRHVGPHDNGGLQRLISTGTLAPTLLPTSHPAYNQSIDVIFATYWFYPAETEMILPEDHDCIDKKMAEQQVRFDPKSKYYGMDDDGYEHAVTHECLKLSGHVMPEGGVYNSQSLVDPYIKHLGQLTVYRLTLTCDCEGDPKLKEGVTCGRVLPYEEQQWPAYMGHNGDSKWVPRE